MLLYAIANLVKLVLFLKDNLLAIIVIEAASSRFYDLTGELSLTGGLELSLGLLVEHRRLKIVVLILKHRLWTTR